MISSAAADFHLVIYIANEYFPCPLMSKSVQRTVIVLCKVRGGFLDSVKSVYTFKKI